MLELAQGRAPGKLILLGEHAVVYGHRAIAVAVSLGTTVRLRRHAGPTTLASGSMDDPRMQLALACALPPQGLSVEIESELPMGRGMGSSAAFTVALLRARGALEGRTPSFEELYRDGFALERAFHGNPSGLDHTVSALGGALLYRRGEPPQRLQMPQTAVVVLDSGTSGNTAEMVAGVAARRPAVDADLAALGLLVERSLGVLDQPEALGALMNEAQAGLSRIGVSTPALDRLVDLALQAGAFGAKLAGAGGGGVVIALCPDPQRLLEAAAKAGVKAIQTLVPESP